MCLFTIRKENSNLYYKENVYWNFGLKEVWVLKICTPITFIFKEHAKIVKIYMVMFNITDLDRIKSMEGGLQIKGKYMDIMPLLIKLLPHFSLFWRNVFFFFFLQIWTLQAAVTEPWCLFTQSFLMLINGNMQENYYSHN